MRNHLFLIGLLSSLALGSIAACSSDPPTTRASGIDASATDSGSAADAGGGADSAADADAADSESASACGARSCDVAVCQGMPYDTCGTINGECSCYIYCLQRDGGPTNCAGGAPCQISTEGAKYCNAQRVK